MKPLVAVLAVLAAVLALAIAPPVASAATAAPDRLAWHDGACAPDDNVGVTVIIDFQELGGGVNVRCTETAPTDGADALDRAGISWQSVVRWGRGFVCKIAGKPADDPCIDTPPASAYWSYWVAPRGGPWCFSNVGVLNRRPPPGSVEGWSFSLDRQDGTSPSPRMAPPSLAPGLTPNPLPKGDCDPGGGTVGTAPPTTATTRPGGGGGGATPTMAPGGGGLGATPTTPDGLPAPTLPDGQPVPTTKPDATTSSSTSVTEAGETTRTTEGSAVEGESDDGGSRTDAETADRASGQAQNQVDLSVDGTEQRGFPLATVLGAFAVALLGLAAWLAQRRRRVRLAAAEACDPLDLS